MRMIIFFITAVMLILPLVGCTPSPTYADTRATAAVAGCWPTNMATPPAVTVTPPGGLAATPAATATTLPGTPTPTRLPTATRLPTTTPYPRCTPGPGEPTLIPFPTPVPPRPPYPTREPKLQQGGSDDQATFLLPGHTYHLKIGVHPTEGWPAIAAMVRFTESDDPIQSFVRVFNPKSGKWSTAQQVDIGASSNGMDRYGSTMVGITGDSVVHAVWGASDPEQDDAGATIAHAALWASDSADYGTSWSAPEPIAEDCWTAEDIAATAGGWVVVTASCYTLNGAGVDGAPTMIVRTPDGRWLPPARLAIPGWMGSEGAVVIVGDGDDARAISLRFGTPGSANGTLYLLSKRLADAGDWQVEQRDIVVPDGATGERHYHPSGLVFPQASGTSGVLFTWTGASTSGIYALTSLDGGQSWGAVEPIVYDGRDPEVSGYNLQWASPAYDPAANRLVIIWTCCGDQYGESTHYASTSLPGSGVWWPASEEMRVPVVLGSRIAWNSAGAQSANARVTWVAWVEAGKEIHARSINLNQLVPIAAYPTVTPRPSPTATGGAP